MEVTADISVGSTDLIKTSTDIKSTMFGLTISYIYGVHAHSSVCGKRHKMAFSGQCKPASFFIALAEFSRFCVPKKIAD
jgi:hypothetical protein